MQSRSYLDGQNSPNPHGISSVKLFDSPDAVIMHLSLDPGERLKTHITPVDVAFYVLEGTPMIGMGSEEKTFLPDTLVESPRDIPHYIKNASQDKVRVLVIKVPKPVTPTIFPEDK